MSWRDIISSGNERPGTTLAVVSRNTKSRQNPSTIPLLDIHSIGVVCREGASVVPAWSNRKGTSAPIVPDYCKNKFDLH